MVSGPRLRLTTRLDATRVVQTGTSCLTLLRHETDAYNRPAEIHWVRIGAYTISHTFAMQLTPRGNRVVETLAAAWHGGLTGADQYVNNSDVLSAASRAMDWWFANDFTEPDCLTDGGKGNCPCGTPGMWNPNWFSDVRCLSPSFKTVSHLETWDAHSTHR